jgi:aminoglycoside 2'-N-acetyltransferase I
VSAADLRLTVVPAAAMTARQRADVIELCGGVFQLDYGYLLDLCPVRTHVLGYLDGQLASHALWLHRRLQTGGVWYEAAYVEGVATAPEHRRQGHGSAVMRCLCQAVQNYPFAALSPSRAEWYLGLGWERWRGPLSIHRDGTFRPTPGETLLICRTPRTPALDLDAPLAGDWRSFGDW